MTDAPQIGSYDVAVLGGGAIGLACGWRAAESGLSVAVVDRASPGAGASGVAAGMLAPVTEADFGEEALLALNLEAADAWPAFAAQLSERSEQDLRWRRSGALVVAPDRDDAEALWRLHELQLSLGLDARRLTRAECRELEPGLAPGIAGGVLAPQDGAVDPRRLLRSLAIALDRAGGELIVGVEAEVEVAGGRVAGLATTAGDIEADAVVIAAGCWSGAVGGLADPVPVRPVKGQIIRLRGGEGPALCRHVVRSARCYVVAREGGEVVVGATMEERGFDTTVTAGAVHELLEAAREVLPDVAELELVEASAGLRPGTPDNAPVIGGGDLDGLLWATGHHRNGVLLAPVTADAIASVLSGEAPSAVVRPFTPGRFRPAAVDATPAMGSRS